MNRRLVDVLRRLPVPAGNVVQNSVSLDVGKYVTHVRPLTISHHHGPGERGIADDVGKPFGRDNIVPVETQGILANNVRCGGERNPGEIHTEFLGDLQVHLMVDEPQGDLSDLCRKILDFDAVKLIDVDCEFLMDVQEAGARARVDGAEDFEFEHA